MPYDKQQDSVEELCRLYSEGTTQTVFFVGAGCSVEVGLPTWRALQEQLLEKILK
jgi:NAD-dependent SIR2 family protein deacetylase